MRDEHGTRIVATATLTGPGAARDACGSHESVRRLLWAAGRRLYVGCVALLLAGCSVWGRAPHPGAVVTGIAPSDWPADTTAPVAIPLPHTWRGPEVLSAHVTFEGGTTRTVPAQCEPRDDRCARRAWIMLSLEPEDCGKAVKVELSGNSPVLRPAYKMNYDGQALHITDRQGQPAIRYVYGPPSADGPYPFTDYLHPIFGLDGETLTDLFPADHRHHRGLFWAWVRHDRDGASLGSWWLPDTVRCVPDQLTYWSGPVYTRFHGRHWLVHEPKSGDMPRRFLRNDVICRVYPTTTYGRVIDIELGLLAGEPGIRLGGTTSGDKGYGGLTFRYAQAKEIRIEADGTAMEKDAIRHRAHWADWNGVFAKPDGQTTDARSGAAVLVHPSHPGFPPEWLLRYYGIVNVSYPGLDMLEIPTDQPLALRYRLWIHRGDAKTGRVQEQFIAYAVDWHWQVPGVRKTAVPVTPEATEKQPEPGGAPGTQSAPDPS